MGMIMQCERFDMICFISNNFFFNSFSLTFFLVLQFLFILRRLIKSFSYSFLAYFMMSLVAILSLACSKIAGEGDVFIRKEQLGVATQKAAGEAVFVHCKMATSDSKAPLRTVKRVQFGILSPDEIVSLCFVNK